MANLRRRTNCVSRLLEGALPVSWPRTGGSNPQHFEAAQLQCKPGLRAEVEVVDVASRTGPGTSKKS